MRFRLEPTTIGEVSHLFSDHHAYASVGSVAAYAFAVLEHDVPVAAYVWQPPAPGAARSTCQACPQGVLALSRMVAVPRDQRELRHISKPLRVQMLRLIDRTRWPVLVTYSDESVGHTGYVYKCSGWMPTTREEVVVSTVDGRRVSRYSNGATRTPDGATISKAWIQRWEHWASPAWRIGPMTTAVRQFLGAITAATFDLNWRRVAIPGKVWRSGNQAYRYEPIDAASRG